MGAKNPYLVGVSLILTYGLLRGMVEIFPVLLLCFFALVMAVLLNVPVRFLSRWMPRGIAMPLVLILLGAAATGMGFLTVPVVAQQGRQALEKVPDAVDRVNHWLSQTTPGKQIESGVKQRIAEVVHSLVRKALNFIVGSVSAVWGGILLLILTAFLAFDPENYRKGVRLWVPYRYLQDFDETWRRIGCALQNWLVGISIAMTIMGSLTALGLKWIGMEQWPLLGVLTFFATFVPYVGAIASAIPGLVLALAQSGSTFFAALAVYVGVHIVEGYMIEPLIMGKVVQIRPGLLLFWQAVTAALLGIPGVVVATPLLVCLQTAVSYLYFERVLKKTPGEKQGP